VKATIVEQAGAVLEVSGPLCTANHDMLRDLLPFKGIETVTSATALRSTERGVVVQVDGVEREIAGESAILSVGYLSEHTLYDAVRDSSKSLHLLGDRAGRREHHVRDLGRVRGRREHLRRSGGPDPPRAA